MMRSESTFIIGKYFSGIRAYPRIFAGASKTARIKLIDVSTGTHSPGMVM
jgi:hypothetical protein